IAGDAGSLDGGTGAGSFDGGMDGGVVDAGISPGEVVPIKACVELCQEAGFGAIDCTVAGVQGDKVTITCFPQCGTGRRPGGFAPAALPGYFAEMARLEAASVFAFARLRD